jgi:hypothetical protein
MGCPRGIGLQKTAVTVFVPPQSPRWCAHRRGFGVVVKCRYRIGANVRGSVCCTLNQTWKQVPFGHLGMDVMRDRKGLMIRYILYTR